MVQLEVPHVNILSKIDLLQDKRDLDKYLDPDVRLLLADLNREMPPQFGKLNEAIASLVGQLRSLPSFERRHMHAGGSFVAQLRLPQRSERETFFSSEATPERECSVAGDEQTMYLRPFWIRQRQAVTPTFDGGLFLTEGGCSIVQVVASKLLLGILQQADSTRYLRPFSVRACLVWMLTKRTAIEWPTAPSSVAC
jgi:hypothetical protein